MPRALHQRDKSVTGPSILAGGTLAPDSSLTVPAKAPRTARGERTLRAILDAAAVEFGERGFADTSIVAITRRAGVALGSFYTYFDSKEDAFRALVQDMSARVRDHVGPALVNATDTLSGERDALASFVQFARNNKEIYRIIDEAEFVDPDSFRTHYETTAARILARLQAGVADETIRDDICEVHAWAIMGMNVFLGLRFGVWDSTTEPQFVANQANSLIKNGLSPDT